MSRFHESFILVHRRFISYIICIRINFIQKLLLTLVCFLFLTSLASADMKLYAIRDAPIYLLIDNSVTVSIILDASNSSVIVEESIPDGCILLDSSHNATFINESRTLLWNLSTQSTTVERVINYTVCFNESKKYKFKGKIVSNKSYHNTVKGDKSIYVVNSTDDFKKNKTKLLGGIDLEYVLTPSVKTQIRYEKLFILRVNESISLNSSFFKLSHSNSNGIKESFFYQLVNESWILFDPTVEELFEGESYILKLVTRKHHTFSINNQELVLIFGGLNLFSDSWLKESILPNPIEPDEQSVIDKLSLVYTLNGFTQDSLIYTDRALYRGVNEFQYLINCSINQTISIDYSFPTGSRIILKQLYQLTDGGWVEINYTTSIHESTIFRQEYIYHYGSIEEFNISVNGSLGFTAFIDPEIDNDLGYWRDTFGDETGVAKNNNLTVDGEKVILDWVLGSETKYNFDVGITLHHSMVQINSTHYLNVYTGYDYVNYDGFAVVLILNTTDWTVSNGVKHEFDTNNAYNSLVQIDSTHYLNTYRGVDSDGFGVVLTVNTTDWTVNSGTKHEFDTSSAEHISLVQINSTHYLATYRSTSYTGYAIILTVNTTDWTITSGTRHLFDSTGGNIYNSLIKINTTHYLSAYNDAYGGQTMILTVNTTDWTITNGTKHEFDTSYGYYNSLAQINSTHYLNAYMGDSIEGQAIVLTVNATDWTVSSETKYEYDDTNVQHQSLTKIDDRHYLCIDMADGPYDAGNSRILTVDTSDWTITGGAIHQYDTVLGYYASVVKVDSTHYLNAYVGPSWFYGSAVVITINQPSFGNLTSSAVSPNHLGVWNQICANVNYSQFTNITFQLLNATDNKSISGFNNIHLASDGDCLNISGLSTDYSSIRLFGNASTTNINNTVTIYDWNITWNTSVIISENHTIPTVPDFAPTNYTIHINASSTATVTNCNLSVCFEGNNSCIIDNVNMSHYGDFWNTTTVANADGIWNWSVTCLDTYGETASVSDNFTISNDVPENLTSTISPIPAESSNNLTANATADDQEGATLTWSWNWFINNISVSTQQVLGSGNISADDQVVVQANASDGYNTTLLNSSILTIGDDVAPSLHCWLSASSGSVTVQRTIYCNSSDTSGNIEPGFPKFSFHDPNGQFIGNYSMTCIGYPQYAYNYTFGTVGTYTNFSFFTRDQSSNERQNLSTQNDLNYTASSTSTPGTGGGTSGEPAVVIIRREEISVITINIHPEVPLAPLSDQFPEYLNHLITFKLTSFNDTHLSDSSKTDSRGNLLYVLPQSIRKLPLGSHYNLTYFSRDIFIKSVQVIIISERELWGVLPRSVVYKISSELDTKCTDIRVIREKEDCSLIVKSVIDVENSVTASVTPTGFRACVSGVSLDLNERVYGKFIVSTDCYETDKVVDFTIVRTTCPDLGIALLVGTMEVFNMEVCRLHYTLFNILLFGGILYQTSYLVKSKKKFNWLTSFVYLLVINVVFLII